MTWQAALDYCEGLTLPSGGQGDWRLPNIKELESITDDTRYYPAIDTNFFPNASASYYWSSTTRASNPNFAWDVDFHEGLVYSSSKYNSMYVRCVRGGQSGLFYNLVISKAGTGSGTVTSSPAGIICGTDCDEAYNHGTSVTLTATPAAGSTFAGWSGGTGSASSCTGTGNCSFNITANSAVTATFTLNQHTLTVTKAGTGTGTVTGGANCTLVWGGAGNNTGTCTVNSGTAITLSGSANAGSTWAGWSGGTGSASSCTGTGNCSFNITANSGVTATFNLTYSISGKVTTRAAIGVGSGTPISGVTMTLSGAASGTTITDGNGNYTFTLPNGNYTVTPSLAGYAFTPISRGVNINNANVTGQNFTGTITGGAPTFLISGTITSGGSPLIGVSVALTGAANATAVTNASGVYTFAGLSNGNYTVTPSLAGFTFAPVNRAVTINNANVTGQDFIGTGAAGVYSISGTVRTRALGVGSGTPISGVTITLSGVASGTTTTDGNGNYSFTGLANGNYTVTPSQTGFTFTPVNRAVAISGANVTGRDFTRN